MAEKKTYVGSIGPFIFDDTDLIDDLDEDGNPSGDFTGLAYQGIATSGTVVAEGGFDNVLKSIQAQLSATDLLGATSIAALATSQTDPNSITSSDVVAADATATYGLAEQTLINELKTDYNLLRADVIEIRTVLLGTIDYCDDLKSKLNLLMAELRKTNGCGVLND